MFIKSIAVSSALLLATSNSALPATYQPNYSPGNLPTTSEPGQTGYNNCGTTDSQTCESSFR